MANTDFQSVDAYIARFPAATQAALEKVRKAIRAAVPDADEVISYQIAAYKLGKERVIYFAGWKEHYSLYPATLPLIAEFQDEMAPYEIKNSTLRFPLAKPVPVKLIGRIAKFRAAEARERLSLQAATKKLKAAAKKKTTVPRKTARAR